MQSIKIRKPFAVAFAGLLLTAAYLGLSTQKIPQYGQSDKGLHFVTFFLLTLSFYWILDTPRRRSLHLTLLVCTAGLAIGSEIVQALLPNDRDFDPYDILANVVGSALALALCNWYHKRMLERRRRNKNYNIVPGEELADDEDGEGERDVELGEGIGGRSLGEQEIGSVPTKSEGATAADGKVDVTGELDNWDENEEDGWDEEHADQGTPTSSEADADTKKRTD